MVMQTKIHAHGKNSTEEVAWWWGKTGSVATIPIILCSPRSSGRRDKFRSHTHDLQKAIREQVTQGCNKTIPYTRNFDHLTAGGHGPLVEPCLQKQKVQWFQAIINYNSVP